MSDGAARRRLAIALRIAGAVLMLAAEACVVFALFGADMILSTVAAAMLMVVGVLVWRRGWQMDR